MEKPLYTYEEAAELLGVTHWTVRRWARAGRLRTTGSGRGRKVTAGSIRRLGELDAEALEVDVHSAPGVQHREKAVCHTNDKARLTGGRRTSNADRELDALLAPRK